MENRAYALAVGLFTVLLGIATALSFWWFSGRTEKTYDVRLITEGGVGGLNEQAAVRFRGVRAGRVTDIDFDPANPAHILVRVRLASDVPLTRATRASLGQQGLTGFVFVQLDDDGSDHRPLPVGPGGLPELALAGASPGLAESAIEALNHVRRVADRLSRVLDGGNRKRIDLILANVERSSTHLEATLARTPELMDKLDRVAGRMDSDKLDRTLANLEKGTANLPETMETLKTSLAGINSLARRLDSVGGDVQTRLIGESMPQLGETLTELRRLSVDMSDLIDSLERNPQSILFGRKAPRPGPGEAGYSAPSEKP
ncbi:MlaD family protein [Niveibacterium terrae]|uniref:MlaD family protein n=1 Tax=Niveibacterium terrae TaxID=3373598 RepID=UPI003A942D51